MHFFDNYNENIVKYDLINKFRYKRSLTQIPKLKKISLRFTFKNSDPKKLITALTALELITSQKGSLISSKVSSVSLKIREGQPIGCVVILRRSTMQEFLITLINKIKIENKKIKPNCSIMGCNIKSFKINNVHIFPELEKNYQFFKNLNGLDISIVTTETTYENFLFLLKSYKIEA